MPWMAYTLKDGDENIRHSGYLYAAHSLVTSEYYKDMAYNKTNIVFSFQEKIRDSRKYEYA
jgi:hypothetical protein